MSQTIFPMIAYENAADAMDWLVRAFGFVEKKRLTDRDGRVVHGELEMSGSTVMVATPTPDYRGPKRHAESCQQAQLWLKVPWVVDGVLIYIHDVDTHFKTAQAEGALILSPIENGGVGRLYRAADLEGHRWMFVQAESK